MKRLLLILTAVGVTTAACGGDQLSLPEYVDQLNAVIAEGNERLEPIYSQLATTEEPTIDAMRSLIEQEASIRAELQESFSDVAAPDQIADLHAALVDWHGKLIEAEEALAVSMASAPSWREFQLSSEYREFESLMEEGLAGCLEMQATLDATEARGAFTDVPWVPGELKEIVDAALGCDEPPDG